MWKCGNLQTSHISRFEDLEMRKFPNSHISTFPDLSDQQRLLHPDAEHRARLQRDVLAFGRRDRAAAANQDADERALGAADDAADDRADARAGADLADLALDAFALERL